ncbi:MAG: MBL fold metallo-hydrolase [Firmicutes bacterium]|nr:MBL fold metallo-hydrolase [Candidatus Caballimonas caccae]
MSTKKMTKKQKEKAVKEATAFFLKHKVLSIILALIIVIGAVGYYFFFIKKPPKEIVGDISFHFMLLGNDHPGDAVYIRAGENDILIDAGSETNSKDEIISYINEYCKDNTLEYVIATHGDSDHIACFACSGGIFDTYKCLNIIDFPKTTKTTNTYNKYVESRNKEVIDTQNSHHYTALECFNEVNGAKRTYQLSESVSMEILYNYYYDHTSTEENNYSVCIMFHHGDRNFLFTGDLEEIAEKKLVEKNVLGKVELYKAGHHGSKSSSSSYLLSEIKPNICVVDCVADDDSYGFPHQEFFDRISPYTSRVFVPSVANSIYTQGNEYAMLNGNIVVISDKDSVRVECSNNDTLLKDTVWFKNERKMPSAWIA